MFWYFDEIFKEICHWLLLVDYVKYQNIKMHEIFLSSDILCLSKSKLKTYLSTNPGEILEQVYQNVHRMSDLIWLPLWHSQTTASRKYKEMESCEIQLFVKSNCAS